MGFWIPITVNVSEPDNQIHQGVSEKGFGSPPPYRFSGRREHDYMSLKKEKHHHESSFIGTL